MLLIRPQLRWFHVVISYISLTNLRASCKIALSKLHLVDFAREILCVR